MSQSKETDEATSRFLARPPTETPDDLLTNFLCSREIIVGTPDETPQQKLKSIINDKRWTRRMLEEWLKKGPQSQHFSVSPHPEFQALYLILLSLLEDQGKHNVNRNERSTTNKTMTEGELAEEQRKLHESISEHFDTGSTWEKVDLI